VSLPELREPVLVAVFAGALVLRHLAQLWLTRSKIPGTRSGWATTTLLFVCYVGAMGVALARVASGAVAMWSLVAGGAIWAAAVAFRMWALAHLAEQFSSLIEVRPEHRLVDTGPYSIVRHPLHLAFGLEVGAFAMIAFSAWAAAPGALVWAVIIARNRVEEAALRAHFGRVYDEYAARVPSMDVVRGIVRRMRRGARPRHEDRA